MSATLIHARDSCTMLLTFVYVLLHTTIKKSFFFCRTEFPSVTVSPSFISVNEGELVRLVCEVTGSKPLKVSWTLSDGSPLPLGVQENRTDLVIAAANSSHPGTYVCSASNLAGTSQDEATVIVHRKLQ